VHKAWKAKGEVRKLFACAFLIILNASIPSASWSTETEDECRAIDPVKERMACFGRFEESDQRSKQAKRKSNPTIREDPVTDQLLQFKNDDALLNKRLNTICRGC
jgi:hypothetical protein